MNDDFLNLVKNRMESSRDPSHDYSHIERVLDNLNQITQLIHMNPDMKVACYYVILLHDLFDEKLFSKNRQQDIDNNYRDVVLQALQKDMAIESIYGMTARSLMSIADQISWSRYYKQGLPQFKEFNSEIKLNIWKFVSMADWMDAQLIWRTMMHCLYLHPDIGKEELYRLTKIHWDEKISKLHHHAFFKELEPLMYTRFREQEKCVITF